MLRDVDSVKPLAGLLVVLIVFFMRRLPVVIRMLDYVFGREGVLYVSNRDLLKFLASKQDALLSTYQATGR